MADAPIVGSTGTPGTGAATLPLSPSPPLPPATGGRGPRRDHSGDGPREARTKVPHFAFVAEVAGPKNENVMCPIDSFKCRGRWARKNLIGKSIDGDFNGMPDLPGLCFIVNTAKRVMRRFDPLADPINKKVLQRAQRVALGVTGVKMTPEKPKTWSDRSCDDNTMKTFIYWVLRMKDAGLMQVLKGEVPEFEDIIKLPGIIQQKQYDQLAGILRGTPDSQIRYMKPVPPDEDDGMDERYIEEIPDPVINLDGFDFEDDSDD